ncbi:MAG: hypothetical protein ABIW02_03525 [Nitrosospira sp.]
MSVPLKPLSKQVIVLTGASNGTLCVLQSWPSRGEIVNRKACSQVHPEGTLYKPGKTGLIYGHAPLQEPS